MLEPWQYIWFLFYPRFYLSRRQLVCFYACVHVQHGFLPIPTYIYCTKKSEYNDIGWLELVSRDCLREPNSGNIADIFNLFYNRVTLVHFAGWEIISCKNLKYIKHLRRNLIPLKRDWGSIYRTTRDPQTVWWNRAVVSLVVVWAFLV